MVYFRGWIRLRRGRAVYSNTSQTMRIPILIAGAIGSLVGCGPALVRFEAVSVGVAQQDAVCASTFFVRADDKVSDVGKRRWPPLQTWLIRSKLAVAKQESATSVAVEFSSRPHEGCTHCDWPADDRWNALLYAPAGASEHFHLEGSNRPGADPGKAFVEALVALRSKTGCPSAG